IKCHTPCLSFCLCLYRLLHDPCLFLYVQLTFLASSKRLFLCICVSCHSSCVFLFVCICLSVVSAVYLLCASVFQCHTLSTFLSSGFSFSVTVSISLCSKYPVSL
ncbi:hypothetical protein NDU88_004075, partial [Pleurodeles waltl]